MWRLACGVESRGPACGTKARRPAFGAEARGALVALLALLAGCATAPASPQTPPLAHEPPRGPELEEALAVIAAGLASPAGNRTITVFELPDLEGRTSDLTRQVSEGLTTELVKRVGVRGRVVERRQVIQVMEELRLQAADPTPEEVTRAARRLGADAIVLGTTAVVGDRVVVNARMVSVPGMQILAAERASVPARPEHSALARSGISDLAPAPVAEGRYPASLGHASPSHHGTDLEVVDLRYRFRALGCDGTGRSARCTVSIENLGNAPRNLRISGGGIFCNRTVIYDDLGNRYCPNVSFGHHRGTNLFLTDTFVPGVPVNVAVLVADLDARVSALTLALRVERREEARDADLVTLRRVPLRR